MLFRRRVQQTEHQPRYGHQSLGYYVEFEEKSERILMSAQQVVLIHCQYCKVLKLR